MTLRLYRHDVLRRTSATSPSWSISSHMLSLPWLFKYLHITNVIVVLWERRQGNDLWALPKMNAHKHNVWRIIMTWLQPETNLVTARWVRFLSVSQPMATTRSRRQQPIPSLFKSFFGLWHTSCALICINMCNPPMTITKKQTPAARVFYVQNLRNQFRWPVGVGIAL